MKNLISIILLVFLTGCCCSGGIPEADSGGVLLEKPVTMDESSSVIGANGVKYNFFAVDKLLEEVIVLKTDNNYVKNLKAFAGAIHILYPEDYEKYMEIKATGRCPAPFLNSNSHLYLVASDKEQVAEALRECKKGDTIQLRGFFVDMEMTKDGREIPMNKSKIIDYVYLDKIFIK